MTLDSSEKRWVQDFGDSRYFPSESALTDGATIATDASLGTVFTVTLGGNRTIATPTNPRDGKRILYRLKQDGTGSRTVTWGAGFRFGSTYPAPTLSTTAGYTDYIEFVYNSTDARWDCIDYALGFAPLAGGSSGSPIGLLLLLTYP